MRYHFKRIFLFFAFSFDLYAQSQSLSFDAFTIENGLSQNSVYSICQTKEGLLWIATNDGINRYDGKYFRVFRPKTSDNIVRSTVILSIITISDYHLLVATDNELLVFDTKLQAFHTMGNFYPHFDFPTKIKINKVYRSSNRLWVLTQNEGVYSYDLTNKKTGHFFSETPQKGKVTDITADAEGHVLLSVETDVFIFRNDAFHLLTLPNDFRTAKLNIREIAWVDNHLWIASHKSGVSVFSIDASSLKATRHTFPHRFQDDITDILKCNSGEVWMGSRSNGLVMYNAKSGDYVTAIAGNNPGQLSKNFILSMYEDFKGNVWVGLSGGGLQKYRRPRPLFNTIKSKINDPAHDPMTFCITSKDDNTFYMGTLIGGLAEYNKKLQTIHYYTDKRLPTESINIYGIVHDKNQLWLATWAGLCSFNLITKSYTFYPDHKYGIGEQLYSIVHIPSYNLLLLSGEKGMVFFDMVSHQFVLQPKGLSELPHTLITARHMKVNPANEVWMATLSQNFIKYNYVSGHITYFKQFSNITSSARHFTTKGNVLWIATNGGLIQSNVTDFSVEKVWTKADGLADDFIYSVLVDNQNYVWVATNRGLSRINLQSNLINNYTKKDGLQDLEFNTASGMKTSKGNLLFGGINGVNEVEVDKIKNIDYTSQPIVTGINVLNSFFEKDTSSIYKKLLDLSYDQNFVSFDFITPNAFYQEELDYKYRLVGVDKNWIFAKGRTYASYTQLAPGTYNFEVVSIDKNGNESKPNEQLVVRIRKPFWMTYWFISLSFLLLASIVYLIASYILNQIKQKHSINQRMAELEMNALQSQMNPHFIFNSLNSISEMIMLKDNSNASKYLTKFARLIRTTLDHSTQDWISLDATITYIDQYLEMEKLRMEKLECYIEVEEGLPRHRIKLPPHLLQPLIENAIWHGVASNKDERVIFIRYYNKDDRFHIDIEDNGIGYNKSIAKNEIRLSKGSLTNIRKRLDLIKEKYNFEIILDIVDKNDLFSTLNGTLVRLTFPEIKVK